MSVPVGFDSRDAVAATTAAVTSISFTEQPCQFLFFGQTCTFLDKFSSNAAIHALMGTRPSVMGLVMSSRPE